MKNLIFIALSLFLLSCVNKTQGKIHHSTNNDLSSTSCPKNHTDSIIPIIYGMPNEELFMQADSGLVMLGGCEVTDDAKNWYCKKHNILF